MKRKPETPLTLVLIAIWATIAAAAPADSPLTLLVYDYTGLTPAALHDIESGTSLLLSRTGIRVEWIVCRAAWIPEVHEACTADGPNLHLVLRIVDHHIGKQENRGDPLGTALIENHCATVYAREVHRSADRQEVAFAGLMAYAISHEIGHLLLGPEHRPDGIMQAVWGKVVYRDMAHRWLSFDSAARDAMRIRVREKVQAASIERRATPKQ